MGDVYLGDKIEKTAQIFKDLGATFLTEPKLLAKNLEKVSCFVFDWDGVFNDGRKGSNCSSNFSEPDSMATHILRYTYWRIHGVLPIIAIITGQHNESAVSLAKREHFHFVFEGYRDKSEPLRILSEINQLKPEQIATMFDDIIDYPLAVGSGVRFLVNRTESPLFKAYFSEHKLADYITFSTHNGYKVREVCELIIGLTGTYDDMLISRFKQKEKYMEYWKLRQSAETQLIKYTGL